MIGQDRERIRIRLAELLKVSTPSELNRTISEYEGELVYLVLADRAFAERLRMTTPSVPSLRRSRLPG